MQSLLLALLVACAVLPIYGPSVPLIRRPQCVCSRKVTAMMQDASGAYCVYHRNEHIRQWPCENQEEWARYHDFLIKSAKEPRCQCTGDVTAIMEDITGTYCVYNGNDERRQWACENTEEWDLYRASLNYKERPY